MQSLPCRSWSERVPASLRPLVDLAYDLSWTYRPNTRALFDRVDPALWTACAGNPVRLLQSVTLDRLLALAGEASFLEEMSACWQPCMAPDAPAAMDSETSGPKVAYFCAEYALSEVLPFYSGGLGVLAGDHFKAARDANLPFVAVGLAYRQGYFRQTIRADGSQAAASEENDFECLPMARVLNEKGEPCVVRVPLGGAEVGAHIWQLRLGPNRLYLLDTDIAENAPEQRAITHGLYAGDTRTRLAQEVILGMGGVRALDLLGHRPTVFHMNEGHAAFMALERVAHEVAGGVDFALARTRTSRAHIFTTHTPVPAGFDVFSDGEMREFLPDIHRRLGVSRPDFMALGGPMEATTSDEGFNMAFLAMRSSSRINGVSKLHGEVARDMWQPMWPGRRADEVPIAHVTNGVHVPTWRDPAWMNLDHASSASRLWDQRNASRAQLVTHVRQVVRARHRRLGQEAEWVDRLLDPNVLTIGFARRFATYKRATLLLREEDRLRALLADGPRPVQFLFAGKAHPKDAGGQALIAEICRFSEDPRIRGRFQFLEGYDMALARHLVAGVDVWLNNPRRPKEASGTSGMKVVLNGGLNASILDGWWDEGFDGSNGWAIGDREGDSEPDVADPREADALLTLFEQAIVPEFYQRDAAGIPHAWVTRMRRSMDTLTEAFSAKRMVADYVHTLYGPAHED